MTRPPECLTLKRNRDDDHPVEAWTRRALLAALVLVLALALANVFGQHVSTARADAAAARLEVLAPARLRSGLIFEARFTVAARRELKRATLVLGQGWFDGISVNAIEPAPVGEGNRDGAVVLEYGRVPAGERLVAHIYFQVNPTTVGRRQRTVELYDGERRLVSVARPLTIFP